MSNSNLKVAVVGLGYVGLPLFVELSKHFKTLGYDLDKERITSLSSGLDKTNDLDPQEQAYVSTQDLTYDIDKIKDYNFFIISVPTPVDFNNNPDLTILKEATASVAKQIKKGSIIVFESTVYPGTTEEVCIPILEKYSSLQWKKDFFVGYSPERINPSDKVNKLIKV